MSQEVDTPFSLAIEKWLADGDEIERTKELAGKFEVAQSTVGRWIRGTARPHPLIQKQILRFIREQS